MRRKKRVICEDFPKGDLDYEAIKLGFRKLREERLAREAALRATSGDRSRPRRRKAKAYPVATVVERDPEA